MKVSEPNKVTVGQLIEGLKMMIQNHDLIPEDCIDWADSIDTKKDEIRSAKDGEFHPIGTILLHITPRGENAGTASFEPRRSSKYWN